MVPARSLWAAPVAASALAVACTLVTEGDPGSTTSSGAGSSVASTTTGAGGSTSTSPETTSTFNGSTTSIAATTSTGAGPGSTGAGGGTHEDCTNGVDDDGNQLVDCADPACAAYVCTQVPQNAGVAVVAASCPEGFDPTQQVGCKPCSSVHKPGDCGVDVHFNTDASCTQNQVVPQNLAGSCYKNQAIAAFYGVATARSSLNESCAPLGPHVFETKVPLCVAATLGGGCNPGFACAPLVAGQPSACVLVGGAGGCPAEYPSAVHLYDDSALHGEGVCDCSSASNQDEVCPQDKIVGLYSGKSDCTGGKVDLPADGVCRLVNTTILSVKVPLPMKASGGTCRASAAPQGGLGAKTLCCAI